MVVTGRQYALAITLLFLCLPAVQAAASTFSVHSGTRLHTSTGTIVLATDLDLTRLRLESDRILFSDTYMTVGSANVTISALNLAQRTISLTSDGTNTILGWSWTTTEPYLSQVSGNLTSVEVGTYQEVSLYESSLAFTVGAPTGNTTQTVVCCGSLGQPTSITGATSASYNSETTMLTVSLTHSSNSEVALNWKSGTEVGGPEDYWWNPFDLAYVYIIKGDLTGFVTAIYTSLLGEAFFAILILIITLPLYLRTQSLSYVSLLWLLLGSVFAALLPPAARNIAYVFIILGTGGLLYKLWRREK